MILVVGASGLLGGMLTRKLLAQGKQVRILTRDSAASFPLTDAGAEAVAGDLKNMASLARAVEGVTTVITTANAAQRIGTGDGNDTFANVDLTGNQNLIDAAAAAGVIQFIFTSAFTADANSPIEFLSYKGRTEQALAKSGMSYTILAPHLFMEVWFGLVIGTALQTEGRVTLVGRGERRHSFVSVDDIVSVALAAMDNPAALNQRIAVGGPEAVSWTEVVRRVARAIGRDLSIDYVPIGSPLPLPSATWDLMYSTEMYDAVIPMNEVIDKFGVSLTSLDEVATRLFKLVPKE